MHISVLYIISVGSIQHEDRAMSNAQALLQSAWLGDAVSVKRYLVRIFYALLL